MKKLFGVLITLVCVLSCTSCGTSSVMAVYDVSLSSVESPENVKEQFGETKIVKLTETKDGETINKYQYEDEYMRINWYYATNQLDFWLENKSGHTIKINWDDISFINAGGETSRIMHKGVKYSERENPQGSISIPKGGSLSDIIVPTSTIVLSGYNWIQPALIPCFYKSKKAMQEDIAKGTWIGSVIKVLFPIEIEGVKNDYLFEFRVDGVLNNN